VEAIAWLIFIGVALWFGAQIRKGYRGEDRNVSNQAKARGSYSLEVVGESNYQKALERICGGRSRDGAEKHVTATLVLEDSNPYDENAVRIDIAGSTVGYLSRHDAKSYRGRLKQMGEGSLTQECRALIRGGWDRGRNDRGNFGVRLDL
jgi:hypothetical protein